MTNIFPNLFVPMSARQVGIRMPKGPRTSEIWYFTFVDKNAPKEVYEAQRFRSRILCFFGRTSYAVYLTHLPILGLMHGLLLGARPDVATPAQWLVTFASLPLCALAGWLLTLFVEEPITAYGRTWTWSTVPRRAGTAVAEAAPPQL